MRPNQNKGKMDDISARSGPELLSILRSIDIEVPPRTEGRTTGDCERWSMCRLLATLAKNNLIRYPFQLCHRDKPDFKIQTGKEIIGVEVTEAIPQDYAAASALSEREGPEAIIDMSQFKWGMQCKTTQEIREIISQDKLTGPGWEGDSPELEWAQAIWDITQNKLQKLGSPDFEKFLTNWLLIYDNLTLAMPELQMSLKYLSEKFRDYWYLPEKFDAVLIESGLSIIKLTSTAPHTWEVANLWPTALGTGWESRSLPG